MFVHRKLGNRESFGDENVAARTTLTFNNSLAFPREKRERERDTKDISVALLQVTQQLVIEYMLQR